MKEFNWKAYLKSRPDLEKNWNSPIRARLHWILFGYFEEKGRPYFINSLPLLIRNFLLQGPIKKGASSKVGIIITYHDNSSRFTIPCLNSVLKHTPKPRSIFAFDNESTEKESKILPKRYKRTDINFIRIDDQIKNGGLTGTWNQGIDLCIENNCDKIILLNHDTLVDESWRIFIQKIINDDACYGPVSNKPELTKADQNKTKEYSLKNKDSLKIGSAINGFCLGFTKKALISNKYDSLSYFNPSFPFGGNEFEWQERFRKKRGKSLVVEGCFVYHHQHFGWVRLEQKVKTSKKNKFIF